MKFLLALGLMALPLMAASLDDYRWKKRLLVVTGDVELIRPKLEKEKAGLEERDVVIIYLDPKALDIEPPSGQLARELQKRLKTKDGRSEVVLLGKDGRTTVRWQPEDFSTKDLFAKIDVMPMRQGEMK